MNQQQLIPQRDGGAAMFDGIAARYDVLNRLMSFGLDRWWRRRLVSAAVSALDSVADEGEQRVLDVATGTADVALRLARAKPQIQVIGLDPSRKMLTCGQQKVQQAALNSRVHLALGDGQTLPFATGKFAASCIAFGIRNVPDRLAALAEMARVTRSGGVVAVLELGEPQQGWMAPLARLHVRHVVPRLGAWLSGAHEYRYLQRSMAAFPTPPAFLELMQQAGLTEVQARPMGFGAVHLFVGRVARGTGLDSARGTSRAKPV